MIATLTFYEYDRKSNRGICYSFIERSLGLKVERVDLDKLVVEMEGYNVKDFERYLIPYRSLGHGGFTSIEYD